MTSTRSNVQIIHFTGIKVVYVWSQISNTSSHKVLSAIPVLPIVLADAQSFKGHKKVSAPLCCVGLVLDVHLQNVWR